MKTTDALADTLWHTVSPHRCQLGESPFWHPQEQMLYWVDILGKQVLRANIYMGSVETWNLPAEPGCMAPTEGGGLVLALRDGIYLAPAWGSELQLLTKLDYDPANMRANDGKCDRFGRFWVGTIDETRSAHNAALYCIDARGRHDTGDVQVACQISPASGMTTANGLAFSPDDATLYWADTPSHTVWAWDFDSTTARITNQHAFVRFTPKPSDWQPMAPDADTNGYGGRPDGAAVDVQGHYWVAMYEGQRVNQFAPDGQLLTSIASPMLCPTMVCFGGEDLKTLYVTSAQHKGGATGLPVQPLAGAVVSMRVQVPGLPVNFFRDRNPQGARSGHR